MNKKTEKKRSGRDVAYQRHDEDIMDRKKSNELVLKEANLEQSLIKTIRKRQLQLSGRIYRHEGLEHLAITGKIEGKRSRGRRRITCIESLKSWVIGKGSNNNFIKITENRFDGGTWSPMSVLHKGPEEEESTPGLRPEFSTCNHQAFMKSYASSPH